MIRRFRALQCKIFGHDIILVSPGRLQTYYGCSRCEVGRNYVWQVEDTFFEDHGLPPAQDADDVVD